MSSVDIDQVVVEPIDRQLEIRVNGTEVGLIDRTPTGMQVLAAAGLRPASEYVLLLWPPAGPTREVALEEVIPVSRASPVLDFLATRADRVFYFVLDEERYAWAGALDVESIRRIGRVPNAREIWLERRGKSDLLLQPGQHVDLSGAGVERLYTRERLWLLDVQGERTEWRRPDVIVKDALHKAGIDVTK